MKMVIRRMTTVPACHDYNSKSKKTLFNVGQCKQYNISSHLKWVLVADKNDEGFAHEKWNESFF